MQEYNYLSSQQNTSSQPSLHCRFYEKKFPVMDELVKVMVRDIEDMGAYVNLLEYDNIEGMILLSELSRRRIRSINKLIRKGRTEIGLVIRTDVEKGYIDLSKRRVNKEDIDACEEKFNNAKTVNQILRHCAEVLNYNNEQFEDLYNKTAWHFDRTANRAGYSYEAFKKIVVNPQMLDECNLDEGVAPELLNCIRHRLQPKPVKIRADFQVSCFSYEGIDAIKRAIKAGLICTSEEYPLAIHLIAPPVFYMTTQTMNRAEGVQAMNTALAAIEASIVAEGGKFVMVALPKVVSESDEKELRDRMNELAEANAEKSGDDSCSSQDEESDDDDDNEEGEEDTAAGHGEKAAPPAKQDTFKGLV